MRLYLIYGFTVTNGVLHDLTCLQIQKTLLSSHSSVGCRSNVCLQWTKTMQTNDCVCVTERAPEIIYFSEIRQKQLAEKGLV